MMSLQLIISKKNNDLVSDLNKRKEHNVKTSQLLKKKDQRIENISMSKKKAQQKNFKTKSIVSY